MEGLCRGWGKAGLDQTGTCLLSCRLRSPKQAPVYPRADCVATNRRLFGITQNAGPQTGTCLLSCRLRSPKQAPVYPRADCVATNRHLFGITQNAGTQTGACLGLQKTEAKAQANFEVPGQLPIPGRALLRFEDGIVVRERRPRRSREGLLRGRGPIKISAGCLLLRPTKVF